MILEVPRLGPPPRTQVTGEGLLSGVRAHVAGQLGGSHEGAAADTAGAIPA